MTTAAAHYPTSPLTRLAAPPGRILLETEAAMPYAPDQVWSVITDYDRLGRFMPNLQSRTVGGDGSRVLVQQTATSSFVPLLRFRILLEFRRQSPERLAFRRLRGSLAGFDGFWKVSATPRGAHVRYRLAARHRFPLPGRLLAPAVRADVEKIMPAIRAELGRRYGRAPAR